MSIDIITASAGSGKTTKLSAVLDEAIASNRVRPEGIIATTFTRHAAAELIERARGRLLQHGRAREAHQLLAARIGTVNAVCGGLVTDFAFELGLSPSLQVLDDGSAELELKRAVARVVSVEVATELNSYKEIFDSQFDWQYELRRIVEASRANGLDEAALVTCAQRSKQGLDKCLGPMAKDGAAIDRELAEAIREAQARIDTRVDSTGGTADYLELLDEAANDLSRNKLRWGDWAMLSKEVPTKKSLAFADPVMAAAKRHIEHPALRQSMHRLIDLMFEVAAKSLRAYREHKHTLGVIDFVDQEALALQLLCREDVCEALRGQIDLVLIDEFQDTSPLQLAIFLKLAAIARESVWVGDQKQAIYGFRGTDPALMDAMIESLTSTTTDPDLVSNAVAAIGQRSKLESLKHSYRSRPELVDVTSDLFEIAFEKHNIPRDRTRLTSALAPADEPKGLGPILEYWPLHFVKPANKEKLAAATAAGVSALMGTKPSVRDRQTGAARLATIADVAVLCRTNEQCQLIADQLANLGIPAVVPRLGVLSTAEGQLVSAALRLYIDAGDSLAAAELARLVAYAGDGDRFFAHALAKPYGGAFKDDPIVAAVLALRAASPDLEPGAAVAAVIDAANLRELCASWGNALQRIGNLDALRAHALAYTGQASSRREAPTLVGMLSYFGTLAESGFGWRATSSDEQALLAGSAAVTVSTWHAAKGREWPITVLYGLESLREPRAHGVHVESGSEKFNIDQPLAGRWLRFWPNPYTTDNQGGPVKDAYAKSEELAAVKARGEREALRLLYVGWTRARDRLIFAASEGKMLGGLVGTMSRVVPGLISEPATTKSGDVKVTWGPRTVTVHVKPSAGVEEVATELQVGELTTSTPPGPYVAARLSPSTAEKVPCTIGKPLTLGPRLSIRGNTDMGPVGDAVHGFFAVDRVDAPTADRIVRAQALLEAHGVEAHLDAAEVTAASDRFAAWLRDHVGATKLHREWPIAHRQTTGTIALGTADLVVVTDAGLVLVDHKTFPGTLEQALARLPKYSGQLATYARALTASSGKPVVSMWIHLPVLGMTVPISIG
jgi:ATP-dependent exoDNAse (exonuclease V) beta subunit